MIDFLLECMSLVIPFRVYVLGGVVLSVYPWWYYPKHQLLECMSLVVFILQNSLVREVFLQTVDIRLFA